jgi:hypothetical protein
MPGSRRIGGLARLAHIARLARRHWLFIALLLLGLGARVLVMIAYRPAILYIDSLASYLYPLPTLDPTGQDPIGYDILLLNPLLAAGHLATVAAIQHVFGLGMAVAGYALLVYRGAGRLPAALAVVPVLFDAYQWQIEHNIMAESLFEALLVAALVTLAWRRPGRSAVIAAGLLLGIAVTVRQAGEPLVLPLVAYPLLAGGAWRNRLRCAALALASFAVPVAAYATYYHSFTGHYAISQVGGGSLYGRVATFADCTGARIPANEQILCPQTPRAQRLGPDYWAHDAKSPYFALRDQVGSASDRLARDFSMRIIRHQPLDFLASVGSDAAKVFSWHRLHQSPADPPVDRWQFQTGFPTFLPLVNMEEITRLSHLYGDGDPVADASLTGFLRAYQLRGGYTPGPVLAVAVLLALAPLARWRRAGPARAPALLFLVSGVLVLLAGDVVVFSWRYQLPGYVLLPVAGVLGLTALGGRGAPGPAAPATTESGLPESAPARAGIDPSARAQVDPSATRTTPGPAAQT